MRIFSSGIRRPKGLIPSSHLCSKPLNHGSSQKSVAGLLTHRFPDERMHGDREDSALVKAARTGCVPGNSAEPSGDSTHREPVPLNDTQRRLNVTWMLCSACIL